MLIERTTVVGAKECVCLAPPWAIRNARKSGADFDELLVMSTWDRVGIVLYVVLGALAVLGIGLIAPMPLGALAIGAAFAVVLGVGLWLNRTRRWPLIWLPLAAIGVQTAVGVIGGASLGWSG